MWLNYLVTVNETRISDLRKKELWVSTFYRKTEQTIKLNQNSYNSIQNSHYQLLNGYLGNMPIYLDFIFQLYNESMEIQISEI